MFKIEGTDYNESGGDMGIMRENLIPMNVHDSHDQLANICIQGYLRILWIRNKKSSKT